ncbi:hypothetical protein ACFW2K_22695 [Streptomyces nigra]|uniref:hypothetical protein n=1 Tax=Streptomyces nigra TaxID=1827580 RepID=UPI0036BB5BAD
MLAQLRATLTQVTRHHGFRDLDGTPATADEAWEHWDNGHTRGDRPLLRELDPHAGVYELRVNGQLRYELRRPAAGLRIDVVVDRDPDGQTDVTVYVNGARTTGPDVRTHVLDPGAGEPDHNWLAGHLQHDDPVPEEVRAEIAALAEYYHGRRHCAHPDCDG